MKTYNFPYIALCLGLTLLPVLMIGGQLDAAGVTRLPLLTLLIVSEFAFFVTAIGAYIGLKQTRSVGIKPVYIIVTLLSLLLSFQFMYLGISFWPLPW